MIDAIIIDSRPDCRDFQGLYKNLGGTILINPTQRAIHSLLFHSRNTLLLSGHGSPDGLFNHDWSRFAISKRDVRFLRLRTIIGVWCYASEFADTYNLHGFFSSMFISTPDEAMQHWMNDWTPESITLQNVLFSERLNNLMTSSIPMNQWVSILQSDIDRNSPDFVRFNYEALTYYI